MREPSDAWKIRLIAVWCGLLALGYIAATLVMADVLRDQKESAVVRHAARLAKNVVEAGQTATETKQFDLGRAPENIKVTTGIYVDRIFDMMLRNSRWRVDFYIWFT